jgi:GDP-L-fucose synthase
MSKPKIYIAGHHGMVGSAIMRVLQKQDDVHIIARTRTGLDLTNQTQVEIFIKKEMPDQIYIAAAKVGGIYANIAYPGQFIYENIMIAANIIRAAFINNVKKILFLGSSCVYPVHVKQPMKEEALLTGGLEPSNEPYAIAKIAGIKICESYNRQYGNSHGIDYRCIMPTNIYGPGDNYHSENSHVISALIKRFHEAKINNEKKVIVWGTGKPRREFIYVDDVARACIFVMNLSKNSYDQITTPIRIHVNAGTESDITIKDLAKIIQEIVGYSGKIEFDPSKPDGSPKKLMNSQRLINLGWKHEVNLREGLVKTYSSFVDSL